MHFLLSMLKFEIFIINVRDYLLFMSGLKCYLYFYLKKIFFSNNNPKNNYPSFAGRDKSVRRLDRFTTFLFESPGPHGVHALRDVGQALLARARARGRTFTPADNKNRVACPNFGHNAQTSGIYLSSS